MGRLGGEKQCSRLEGKDPIYSKSSDYLGHVLCPKDYHENKNFPKQMGTRARTPPANG